MWKSKSIFCHKCEHCRRGETIKAHYDTEIRPIHAITIRGSVSQKEWFNYVIKPTLSELGRKSSMFFRTIMEMAELGKLVYEKEKYFFCGNRETMTF